jgi:hypothetical protein
MASIQASSAIAPSSNSSSSNKSTTATSAAATATAPVTAAPAAPKRVSRLHSSLNVRPVPLSNPLFHPLSLPVDARTGTLFAFRVDAC